MTRQPTGAIAMSSTPTPDLILVNGRFTTLDLQKPQAEAVSVHAGKFIAVGSKQDVMSTGDNSVTVIDLGGRRAIPGLIDSHMHIIRGGLNYNLELRWDGVHSLADAMGMLREQVARTPAPQWVRVVGGFTEHQFVEKRLPTIDPASTLASAWFDSPAFSAYRGTGWMPEPCRSCDERERDWGRCRCQALALVGDAGTLDPVCEFSPKHEQVVMLAHRESQRGDVRLRLRSFSIIKAGSSHTNA
ncbi:hypothetical protein OR16_10748 [Cupriavidus basilensis OR16]|uniref:Amidohydrolase 3 domain-containing protein n=1 Tax=Cupriavidus basilensis OR16 TaxID=1127483 RepID=H1S335_9BURK|nr:hypothetical protein OR16_10748 [Cupriavidus basilensis OR16]